MQKKYFARANTSSGLINFAEDNLKDVENFYILKGKSDTVIDYVIKNVAKHLEGLNTEAVVSPFDIKKYDAIVLRDIKTAIVDEQCITAKRKGKYIDTDRFIITKDISKNSNRLNKLYILADENLAGFYNCYKEAKIIHDKWEKIYIANINYDRLNKFEEGLLESLIQEKNTEIGTQNYKRFFGASTPDGSVNYIDNITDGLKCRYFIKGRPGTGKSTFLKKLARRAEEMGYNFEMYYCSFDPESLDMIIIPKLSFCVFDSTAPHELFPSKNGDIELDFYKEAGLIGTDKEWEKELKYVKDLYTFRISEGLAKYRLYTVYKKEIEYYYEKFTNFELADKCADKIIRKILGT